MMRHLLARIFTIETFGIEKVGGQFSFLRAARFRRPLTAIMRVDSLRTMPATARACLRNPQLEKNLPREPHDHGPRPVRRTGMGFAPCSPLYRTSPTPRARSSSPTCEAHTLPPALRYANAQDVLEADLASSQHLSNADWILERGARHA
jgi:hypothetical protein